MLYFAYGSNLHHFQMKRRCKDSVFIKKINLKNFKEVDHIHFFGYYIGNYPSLKKDKILKICEILNKIKYE